MFVILWSCQQPPESAHFTGVEAEAQGDDLPRHQLSAGKATTGLLVCRFPV